MPSAMDYTRHPDVDSGYSWVVLLASSSIYMITIGSLKCFGVLFTEIQNSYSIGSGNTAGLGSVRVFLISLTVPFANYFCVKKSFKTVLFIGGFLFGMSFLLSAFVNKMELMYITYSIVGGLGNGMNSGPSNTIVNFFFVKRRSFANGVVVAGSAIGSLLLPHLYRYLFDTYGLHGGMLVLSGVSFQICVAASVIRQPSMLLHQKPQNKPELSDSSGDKSNSCLIRMKTNLQKILKFDSKLIRNRRFIIIIAIFSVVFLPHTGLYFMIPAQVEAVGLGKQNAATTLSITGISELAALITFGWFLDLDKMSPKLMFVISTVFSGIITLLVPLMYKDFHFWIYAVITGLFPASIIALFPLILIEEFGVEHLPATFGLMSVCRAVPTIPGLIALGVLEDVTGSWDTSFIILGAMLIFCGVVIFILWYQSKIKQNSDKAGKDNTKPEILPMLTTQSREQGETEEPTRKT